MMMPEAPQIAFTTLGLASVLSRDRLAVPPNQRNYEWEETHVQTLLNDISRVLSKPTLEDYFLGTIVTLPRDGYLEVVDGQQRLATTAIIFSVIRNYLNGIDQGAIATHIDSEYLVKLNLDTGEMIPQLQLNLDDNEYFRARLTNAELPPTQHSSHKHIDKAFEVARNHIEAVVAAHDVKDHADILKRWISYFKTNAFVVLLQVPKASDAFRMFETLNDRGLKTSESDLVKNYLFGRADERMEEVQQNWAYMRASLEAITDDDITITFLRHALTIMYGLVKTVDIYDTVQNNVLQQQAAVTFANQLELIARTYVAINSSDHEKWSDYSETAKRALKVLNLFNIKPMRSLLLAIAHKVEDKEVERMFQFCVSLSIRLMITGGTRTGRTEEWLADAAHRIYGGDITRFNALKTNLKGITPTNEEFRNKFEGATVSNRKLARYYLRSLEMVSKEQPEPWHIPNEDSDAINLEHVLPEKPEENWPQFTEDEVKIYCKRIGNLALLNASSNSSLRSVGIDEKQAVFKEAGYDTTKLIADADGWGTEQIIERQKRLALLAVKAWPI